MRGVGNFRTAFDGGRRLVFAHRGGAKLAPENTLAAFENGLGCGADGIECDVHLSRDGVPVVIHDATLERTTNATGPVSALTAAQLARVDAGHHFTSAGGFPFRGQGLGVPPLEAVLRQHPMLTIIELKRAEPELARAVVRIVRQIDAVERVCIGSFHRQAVAVVRDEAPEIATSASVPEARWTLYKSWCRVPSLGRKPYVAFQVPEYAGRMRVVSPAFVRQVHAERATVQVWVVDAPADVQRLFDWGVDAVISDRPDLAMQTRDAWMSDSHGHR
ncbi:MAG TPA: glycerophosphodiester phosphodiesterase [Vicinamibacterales bacterium]|nr:glycerophosphodiester phosphodiesterase [Vicinamibacterales bacterium]